MNCVQKTAKPKAVSTVKNDRQRALKNKPDGAPFNQQDPKRRLGNYGGAGEHPRQGGRTAGIVGHTKQRNKTDK